LLVTWFPIEGRFHEPLPNVSRETAVVGDGEVQRLSSMGGPYVIVVQGLAADGTPGTPSPSPGTPEPLVVIIPVGTPIPICEWECILRSVDWPEYEIPSAMSVSWCESRWQDVQNHEGGDFWGRFQVSPYWHGDKLASRGYPVTGQVLLDPWVNAEIALMIWQRTGWDEWECQP